MSDPTTTPTAPTASAVETPAAPVEKSLAQFRAEKAAPVTPTVEPAPVAEPVEARSPLAGQPEPPEPADEPEPIDPAAVKPPEQGRDHRWKDPDTGITLDLRRRDHRRIKKALEDRYALAQQLRSSPSAAVAQPAPAPAPTRQAPSQMGADPADPEPQLEQFADQADPYLAHSRALARWEARQEHKQLEAQRASVERTSRTQAAIESAQQAFDAKLPEVRQRYPDFDQAHAELHDSLSRVSQGRRAPIVHRLLTSPVRHDLAYFLGNNPQELQRLVTARTPHEQAIELGAIEASVKAALKPASAAPAQPMTPASAPMTPVGAGATPTSYDARTADLAAFRAKHGVRGGRRLSA